MPQWPRPTTSATCGTSSTAGDRKVLDLAVLALVGGRERIAQEYRELLATAGLELARVLPTESAVSVVELVRA
jgi:hypothetical protein